MSRSIHVMCGGAFHVIEALARSSKEVVSIYDDLSCGPLPELRDAESWCTSRLAFWDHVYDTAERPRARRRRVKDRLHPVVAEPKRLIDATEIVLWLGTGLEDQLTLAWMPQFLRAGHLHREAECRAVRTGRGRPRDPETLHHERRRDWDGSGREGDRRCGTCLPRSSVERRDLCQPWGVLLRFLGDESNLLPLVPATLGLLLWRYPDFRSGVNRLEAHLLANTRDHGPRLASVIGHSMMALHEEADRAGDLVLWWRMRRLADPALRHPAVTMTGSRASMSGTDVHLTEVGERIVSGERNFVELNGIDDWVGGVHLDSKVGNAWFHRGKSLIRG